MTSESREHYQGIAELYYLKTHSTSAHKYQRRKLAFATVI